MNDCRDHDVDRVLRMIVLPQASLVRGRPPRSFPARATFARELKASTDSGNQTLPAYVGMRTKRRRWAFESAARSLCESKNDGSP